MPYCVEGLRLPFATVDLVHADERAELLRKLGERGVAFAEQQIARLFGGVLIDANAAAAHLQHHRQQVDFEPIGVARSFAIQDRVERLKQLERARPRRPRRTGRQSAPAVARCAPVAGLLAPLKARGLDRLLQQRLVLAGQAVARAERVEAVGELVLVDHGRERADLFEPIGWRHHDADLRRAASPNHRFRSWVTMRTSDAIRSLSQR